MKRQSKPFAIGRIEPGDKTITIYGPPDPKDPDGYWRQMTMAVDFDDVDTVSIRRQVRKMIAILNEHWQKPVPKPRKAKR